MAGAQCSTISVTATMRSRQAHAQSGYVLCSLFEARTCSKREKITSGGHSRCCFLVSRQRMFMPQKESKVPPCQTNHLLYRWCYITISDALRNTLPKAALVPRVHYWRASKATGGRNSASQTPPPAQAFQLPLLVPLLQHHQHGRTHPLLGVLDAAAADIAARATTRVRTLQNPPSPNRRPSV